MLTFGKGATVFFDLAIAIKVSCLVCSLASEVSSFSREAEPLPLLFFPHSSVFRCLHLLPNYHQGQAYTPSCPFVSLPR